MQYLLRMMPSPASGGTFAGLTDELRARFATFAMLAALSLFGLAALFAPLDAANLVAGDPLYVIHMLDFGLLDYRPPLSNRWVPDGLLHLLVSPLPLSPAARMILVGVTIFVVTAVAIWSARGAAAFALYLLALSTAGFDFVNSINHFALPLCLLAYMWARGRAVEYPVLLVVVFSNPLILFPLALVLLERDEARLQIRRLGIVSLALAASAVYAEFSPALPMLLVALPVWAAGAWIAMRLGLRDWYVLALFTALPVAAIVGIVPVRYAVPVAACMPLLLFPWRPARPGWPAFVLPLVVVGIMLASVNWSRHDRLAEDFDCLAEEIARREIPIVATDHWNAKPLDFARKARGVEFGIVQARFDDGTVHSIMAPYAFYDGPTRFAVRGIDSCEAYASWSSLFCGQPDIAPVVSMEPLCRNFELYRFANDLPLHVEHRPYGKLDAVLRNLNVYLDRFSRLSGL